MLTSLVAAALLGQVRTSNLPKMVYEIPVVGGQREMIEGPKPYDFMLLNGYYEKDFAARKLATPSNTGAGYVDSWTPGGTEEFSLGYFDFSTKPGTLFEKPCTVITTSAKWNQKTGKKPNELKWQNSARQQWWIGADGKILRHFSQLQTPEGVQTGDCTYGADSVQRRYTDVRGKTSFGEVFPSCGMEALHDQFKPIFEAGKLLAREKQFFILNPLTGGLDKYGVYSAGRFRGNFLFAGFEGQLFDIEGPDKIRQRAFIDDKGDLVKVQLDEERYFVIGEVPKSHKDEFNRPIPLGKKDGGG